MPGQTADRIRRAAVKLEELIYKRFAMCEGLARHLASYMGLPAVFSPEAPDEGQEGWRGVPHYPRIEYSYDLQADGERKAAGTLSVALLCRNAADTSPEEIEPQVRACLKDVLLMPDGGTPYCFTWAGTDGFSMEDKNLGLVAGSEVRFDILEYPSQETTDPDPVETVNRYIKGLYPECLAAGYDRMGETEEASAERPVVYCRLASVEKTGETNTACWMECRIAVHILCPDSGKRMKMAADTAGSISLAGELIMPDHSPMSIRRVQEDYRSDYMKDGQILITGRFGLLRYREKPHSLRAARAGYTGGRQGGIQWQKKI